MSWNQTLGKKLNKETILQQIILHDFISRNDIITNTNLKKATVANLVNELLDEHLIIEAGKDLSTGGRRSELLKFNKLAGYALGIDIGVNYLRGVVVDLRGTVIYEHAQIIKQTQFDTYFEHILFLIDELEQHVPNSYYKIIGIGIAVPGLIDMNSNILTAPNLKWTNIQLKNLLSTHVTYPIYISNEANAGAIAEYTFTQNKQQQNMLYVSIGIGIGIGIIVNGELYQGQFGFSGESGHTIINVNGKRCTCGQNGCWEAYASEYALIKEAEFALQTHNLSIEKLLNLAEEQLLVQDMFKEIGFYIGVGLINLIHTFNPNKIIIGNRITIAQQFIEEKLLQTVEKHSNPLHMQSFQIEFSTLRDRAISIGAAAIVVERFLKISN